MPVFKQTGPVVFLEFKFSLRNSHKTRQNARNSAKNRLFSNMSWFQILPLDLIHNTVHGGFTSLHKLVFGLTLNIVEASVRSIAWWFLPDFHRYPIFYWPSSCKVPLSNSPRHYTVLASTSYLPKPIFYQDQTSIKSSFFNKTPLVPHKRFYTTPVSAVGDNLSYLQLARGLLTSPWRYIGDKAATPPNVCHYQPNNYPIFPKCRPVYRFDPKSYCGAVDKTKLMNDVKRSLVGDNCFLDNKYDTDLYRVVRLVCSFSKKLKKATLYKDKCFMKVGTKTEPLKVRGLATFDRLGNAKLKRSKKTTGAHSKSKTKTNGVKEKGKITESHWW